MELSRKYGTGIICVSGNGNLEGLDPASRKAMTFMQGFASEMDNDNRVRVFREKKAERFRRGQLAAGRLPLGYIWDKRTRQVNVNGEQAAAVRTIFDLYVNEDLSIVRVALRLKEMGIPPPSKLRGFNYRRRVDDAWDFDVIRNILRNEAYASGVYHYPFAGENYDIPVPTIVERHVFDRAQGLLKNRRRVQRSGREHLFSGRINCGVCEQEFANTLEGSDEPARSAFHKGRFWDRRIKDYRPVYYCRWRNSPTARLRSREPCKSSAVLWLAELETTLWRVIVAHLTHPDKLASAAMAHLAGLDREITTLTRGVGHIEQRMVDLERERERWRESWVKFGGDPKSIEERIVEIDSELSRLRAQAEERQAQREKLDNLRANKALIVSALRYGTLDIWDIEDKGEDIRVNYQAGLVKDEDYERWSRLPYDPERLGPEDWAAWERASVRLSKRQVLDLLDIKVIAWPNRIEVRGLVNWQSPLKDIGLPDSSRIRESCDIARFSSRSGSFRATRSDTPQNCFGSRTFE
jgi:hypothetical protein